MNKYGKRKILNYLTEYLIMTLNELTSVRNDSDFNDGEFWAYIECLEVLSMWSGFKKYKMEDIEKQFNLNEYNAAVY